MTLTPDPNRVIVFIDGQNTYMRISECFPGLPKPGRYDVIRLAECVTHLAPDRTLVGIRYYTGIQHSGREPEAYRGRSKFISTLESAGVVVKRHTMKYADDWVLDKVQPVPNPCCQARFKYLNRGREKGIDILLALDLVLMANVREYDTAIVVSQDTDIDVAVHAAQELADGKFYLSIENAFIAGGPNKARLANTLPRPLTRAVLEGAGVIEPAPPPLTLPGVAAP